MSRNIGKNESKNLNGKYSQKRLDHAKQSATDALKTASKRPIQKISEATGYLMGNKLLIKLQKSQKTSPQNNSEKVSNKQKIPKERHISPEKRLQIINDLKLV